MEAINKILKIEKEKLHSGLIAYNVKCLDGVNLKDILTLLVARKDYEAILTSAENKLLSVLIKSAGAPRYMMFGFIKADTIKAYFSFMERKLDEMIENEQ
jgi:hypothetical protein